MPLREHVDWLEAVYDRYARRERTARDPVGFLRLYDAPSDREVAGLLAACLAYGNIRAILRSVQCVLGMLGPHPAEATRSLGFEDWHNALRGFRHRFASGEQVAALLSAVGAVLHRHQSLESCVCHHLRDEETLMPALSGLVDELRAAAPRPVGHLLSDPRRRSACKRLNLYLRWMVRRDPVDLGCWPSVPARKLVIPLDVHMHRFGVRYGIVRRKQANLTSAMELTDAFRQIRPDDPVRYDFALTHWAIDAASASSAHRRVARPEGG